MPVGRRSIGRSVSNDFRHFSKPQIIVTTGADMPPSHVWYTNGKTALPDAPDNHVMLPWLWEMERDAGLVWLFSSADGWTWSLVPGGPVVSPGAPVNAVGCPLVDLDLDGDVDLDDFGLFQACFNGPNRPPKCG